VNGTQDQRPVLVLPVGRTVRFELEAADVIHSFWVPEFLTKKDLIPGVDNAIDVDVVEAGEWVGRCAEYCGFDHWRMTFDVRAVPADEYDAWVAEARAAPQPILGAL
jgi:cytochrome c oxidase subunit 2